MFVGNSDIFEQIMAQKRERSVLTDKTISISDKIYSFVPVLLFEGTIIASLPEDFSLMKEDWIVEKYPSANRTQVTYINVNGTIDIGLDLLENAQEEFTETDRTRVLLGMSASIKKLNPAYTFYAMKSEGSASWFGYRSYALDGDLYNIMFAVSAENTLVIGNFCCDFNIKDEYDLFAKRIILSIKSNESEVLTDENHCT